MFDVGGGELILIVLVVLLLFGPKKLPELARSVGKGLRQVRRAQEDLTQQIRDISAEVAEPVKAVADDARRNLNVTLNEDSAPRATPKTSADQPQPPAGQKPEDQHDV